MKVEHVGADTGELADPAAAVWGGLSGESVPLAAVPLEAQPTQYIRTAWADREYGRTPEARVAAAQDGQRLYVRIEWADDDAANGEFQDAAGVLFPIGGAGSLTTLGDQEAPVALWYWEHGRPGPVDLTARGPGVFRTDRGDDLAAAAVLNDGRWAVVLSGPVEAAVDGRLGVAVWNGSNEERGGLAAVSQDWLPLEVS